MGSKRIRFSSTTVYKDLDSFINDFLHGEMLDKFKSHSWKRHGPNSAMCRTCGSYIGFQKEKHKHRKDILYFLDFTVRDVREYTSYDEILSCEDVQIRDIIT